MKKVEIRIYLKDAGVIFSKKPILNTLDAADAIRDEVKDLDREIMGVLNVDTQGRPINFNIVNSGGIDSVGFSIMNIFKSAILSNAHRILMFHNHPGGTLYPSKEDLNATDEVKKAGELLGIRLMDHIIVAGGSGDYYSFRENGMV